MKIVTYLNINKEEIEAKKYNIWFGISLGNKFFSKENIERYILWAVQNTKEKALILIADSIHAINIEVFNDYKKSRAEEVALRRGMEKRKEIEDIIEKLNEEDRRKIEIVHMLEIEEQPEKKNIYQAFKAEFSNNLEFKKYIISIIKEYPQVSQRKLLDEDYERLADYILRELPVYINGIDYKGTKYLLQPYPGLGGMDHLVMGLQDKTMFPELSKRLNIKEKSAIVEIYVE